MIQSTLLHWDYSDLASTYDLRADYCMELVNDILQDLGLKEGDPVLDIGAGTGKLTVHFCKFGLDVVALEPNACMRKLGLEKPVLRRARWLAARGETLPLCDRSMKLVAYGSSFNVLPAHQALAECARVLRPGGHWLALWNHRDLADPLQQVIEDLICRHIADYDYGRRRDSPKPDVAAHDGFTNVVVYERRFIVETSASDWLQAWHSHATLQRQAGRQFPAILDDLRALIGNTATLRIPYFTRAWTAQRKSK